MVYLTRGEHIIVMAFFSVFFLKRQDFGAPFELIKSCVISSKQKDEKRASVIMNTLDIYAETLSKAWKRIEEKNKFEAENIGNIFILLLYILIM